MRKPKQVLDELIVLRSQEGDQAALGQLVATWQRPLWAYARRLTGTDEGASEVAQESWVAILRGLRRLRDPASFRTWAFRIVTRKAADWVRRRRRARERDHEVAVAEQRDWRRLREPSPDPGDELELIIDALAALPDRQRVILSLFYLQQMSVVEIARVLDVPAGTVKSRLFHARDQLRESLVRSEKT